MSADISAAEPPPTMLARVRGLLLRPTAEWARIAEEAAGPLLKSYVVPLAALGGAAGAVAQLMALNFRLGADWSWLLIAAALQIVFTVAGIVLVSACANFLAPRFGGERNGDRSKQLAVYAATALLVALLAVVVPVVGLFIVFAGFVYSAILLAMGAPALMAVPRERVPGFVLSLLAAAGAIALIAGMILTPLLNSGREALAAVTPTIAAPATTTAAVQERPLSDVERALARNALDSSRPAPIDPARLQEQLPQTLPGGFALQSATSGSLHGLSQARGEYRGPEGGLSLTIAHLGAVADASAAAAALDAPAPGAGGYLRRETLDGRLFIERGQDDTVQYVVIGRGVALRVDGVGGVTVDRARSAVETIGVQRLEREFGG
jgi:hypothetical protein